MNSAQKLLFVAAISLTVLISFSRPASAIPLQILPEYNDPGTVLHVWDGITPGPWAATLILDPGQISSYDPETGSLNLFFNVQSLSSAYLGTLQVATVNPYLASEFNNNSGALAGILSYNLILEDGSRFNSFLASNMGSNPDNEYLVNLGFFDVDYGQSNSWDGEFLHLWGGNGFTQDGFDPQYAFLGSDLHLKTGGPVIPEPMSISLMTGGLLGLFGFRRKIRKA